MKNLRFEFYESKEEYFTSLNFPNCLYFIFDIQCKKDTVMQPKEILNKVFGYSEFRGDQEAIINSIISKNDTVIIMPTGGGKSICFQIPALIFEGITVVISPLISLMKDQVEQLLDVGIKASFLNSTLDFNEYNNIMDSIRTGEIKLLYVAPETLVMDRTVNLLKSIKVDCFAVDEAHCISEWGHDFRPEYRKIAALTQEFPEAVIVGATATATPVVQNDIAVNLKLRNHHEFISSFDRKNLFLEVREKSNQLKEMMDFIKQFPNESGLVYCFSRKQVDNLAEFLAGEGLSVKPYHAGLSDHDRKNNQELFIRDDVQIVVATVAFGMGINKPNIRWVIHNDLPKDVETYYQQIGRAGRDGLDSHCLLFYSYGDVGKIKYFIGEKEEQQQKIAYNHLEAILEFCETHGCRRKSILEYFGEEYSQDNCGKCDNCMEESKDLTDLTVQAQKFLSCIKRTDERFGANHIINVLRGSKDKKVTQFHHDTISTYGIGSDISKKQWLYISRQLVRSNYLFRDETYGSLQLNENSWKLLKNEEQFFGKLVFEEKRRKSESFDYNSELFDILRRKRKVIADEAGVPPYIVFSDKSVSEMAKFYPQSKDNFLKIHGIGEFKYEKYGEIFINFIADYCAENNIKEVKRYALPKKSGKKKKHLEVGEMFNNGATVDDICRELKVQEKTVTAHLYKFIIEGNQLSDKVQKVFIEDQDLKKKIFASFEKVGTQYLKPVFDDLEGNVDYDVLRLVMLEYMVENSSK